MNRDRRQPGRSADVGAVIFDVDGVLLGTPQHAAWSAAVIELAAREPRAGSLRPDLLTPARYHARVAGRSRQDSAQAVLRLAGLAETDASLAGQLAALKQAHFWRLVREGAVSVYADAIEYLVTWRERHRVAAASASRNARALLQSVSCGPPLSTSLDSLFAICLAGEPPDKRGLFARAASELEIAPADCLIVEDAPAGVTAGVSLGAAVVGIARRPGDAGMLMRAGASWVVSDLRAAPLPPDAGRQSRAEASH